MPEPTANIAKLQLPQLWTLYEQYRYESPKQARLYIEQIVDSCKNSLVEQDKAMTFRRAGRSMQELEDSEQAVDYFKIAIRLHEQLQQPKEVAKDHCELAYAFQQLYVFDKAQEHFQRAYEIYSRLEDDEGILYTQFAIGNVHNWKYEYDESEAYLKRSIEMARARNNIDIEAKCAISLAILLVKLGRFSEASDLLDRARHLNDTELHYSGLNVQLLKCTGNLHLEQGEYQKAIEVLHQALDAKGAERAKKSSRVYINLYLSKAYEKLGRMEEALYHFKQYHELETLTLNNSHARQLQKVEKKREQERVHAEAEIYRLKNIELKEAQEALQRNLDKLGDANTELKKYIQSNLELERFAYIASHDLREPVRTVISFSKLLERKLEGNPDEEVREYLNYIVDGTNRMNSLIKGLLDFSRVDTASAQFEELNLNKVLHDVLVDLHSSIQHLGAEVILDKLPSVKGDRNQLMRVFQNLICNGLKFNESSTPTINVGYEDKGDEYHFHVRDNGIGLSMEYKDKIFAIFRRLHSREDYQGSGLGLAICKKIVERHGGKIWVESVPGQGATFYFSLPKKD